MSGAWVPARGRSALVAAVVFACLLMSGQAGATGSSVSAPPETEGKVFTDGHLRAGHFETIRVTGFPGKGKTAVSFFPTAICGNSCGAVTRPGGETDGRGAAKFKVRVPGTFLDHKNRRAYFRNGERIDLQVLWYGPSHSFNVGSSRVDPILVRTNGDSHG